MPAGYREAFFHPIKSPLGLTVVMAIATVAALTFFGWAVIALIVDPVAGSNPWMLLVAALAPAGTTTGLIIGIRRLRWQSRQRRAGIPVG